MKESQETWTEPNLQQIPEGEKMRKKNEKTLMFLTLAVILINENK